MKVGDLYIVATARIGEALKSLDKLVDELKEAATQVKEVAEPIGEFGAVIAAGIAGAVAVAMESNEALSDEVGRLKELVYTMAADIGDLFLPVVRRLADFFERLVVTFQQMSPAMKRSAADLATWVAGVGLAIGFIGKLAGVVEGLAGGVGLVLKVLSSLQKSTMLASLGPTLAAVAARRLADFFERLVVTFQQMSPAMKRSAADLATWVAGVGLAIGFIGKLAGVVEGLAGGVGLVLKVLSSLQKSTMLASLGPTLAAVAAPAAAIAAAVAGLTLLAGSVYGAWTDTSTGLRDSVLSILSSIGAVATRVWELLTSVFKGLASTLQSMAAQALDTMAWLIRMAAKAMGPMVKALPKTMQMGRLNKALDTAQQVTGASLLKDLKDGASFLEEKALAGAQAVSDALSSLGTSVADIATDVGKGVAFGFSKSLEGTRKLLNDLGLTGLLDSLMAMMPSLASGQANIRQPGNDNSEKSLAQLQREEGEAASREVANADFFEGAAAAAAFAQFEKEVQQFKDEASANLEMEKESREELRNAVIAANEAGHESFRQLSDDMRRWMEETRQAIASAKATLASKFAGAMSQISSLVDTAMTGMAAGGPMGAIGAVVGELLVQSEAFATLMEMVSVVIKHVAEALSGILVPLQPLVGAIFLIIEAVTSSLVPVFTALGELVEPLVPPLVLLGQLLQGLSPLLSALAQAFLAIMAPINLIAGPVLKGLFGVLKFISTVILTVAQALGKAWNAIVGAVQAVIRGISKAVEWLGIDSLKNFANGLDRMKVDTDAMGESLDALRDLTWDSAEAKAKETAEVLRNTAALQKATDALTNVPNAWKVAFRRYQSQDAQDGPSMEPTPTPPPPPSSGGAHGPEGDWDGVRRNRVGDPLPDWKQPRDPSREYTKGSDAAAGAAPYSVTIVGYDLDEAVEAGGRLVRQEARRRAFRRSGRTEGL
ncbi:hypothetical protein [Corallococcus macrosporus]|uniref:Uncharacterized protein n=1 Tax=Myxococcus fulvus (strain ATCC BAA-855 / HW-1) TaxID=483219 RepID=F8C7Y7_MYXFH|nr:hypothetical protein [Corallococcus macrosporus]AEI66939.1 hypothetical protein LILAB_25230 [Corallococcus macrosporus]